MDNEACAGLRRAVKIEQYGNYMKNDLDGDTLFCDVTVSLLLRHIEPAFSWHL
jgi:hypothetical protein